MAEMSQGIKNSQKELRECSPQPVEPFNPGIFEGCVHHKPRKRFDIECNRCLVRAIRLLADRVKVLEEKNERSTVDDTTG